MGNQSRSDPYSPPLFPDPYSPMKVGARTLISAEAAAAWRRAMEPKADEHATTPADA